ncbi:MAG: hypothetical protein BRC33_00525 [Cyanobacteria bacterium SW_9_44_58]|nr:MAG: hypothetical protein BRC33_00525 [Cyanobacteria bacterium SW_9_44_58]
MTQISEEERTWAMACHLAGLIWIPLYWLQFPLPLINVFFPGILWLFKREASDYVDLQGREALNFQIALFLYSFVLFALGIVGFFIYLAVFGADVQDTVGAIALVTQGIDWVIKGVSALATLWSLALVPTAAVKAKKGQVYFYPLTIRVCQASQD